VDNTGNVRLKLFATRQITGMHTRRNEKLPVREQEAAILALLMLSAEKFGPLGNGQIGALLEIEEGRASAVMKRLKRHGLVNVEPKGRRKLYSITEQGIQGVARFVDEVLGTPESIERELRNHPEYLELVSFAGKLIDAELDQRFAALTGKSTAKAHGL
jgi:DNA-binding PadR family transcriptional regulator